MIRKTKWLLGGAVILSLMGNLAQAGVSPAEAARLKTDLTPFGSIRAGNQAGTIPAWTGGLSTPPKSYTHEGQHLPNPFPDDKVLFTITAKNVDLYKDHLSKGVVALIKQYPTTFKVPVYQSRRTHTVPKWVMDNIYKNATNANLVGDGAGISGAYGGYPFPILYGDSEHKAWEAMWNHLTRWRGVFVTHRFSEAAVQQNGDYSLVESENQVFFNFYNPKGNEGTLDNLLFDYIAFTNSPPRLAGSAVLIHEPINQIKEPRQAWGYNAGQRRVRRAPSLAYDSPIATSDNLRTADDTDMFNGAMDRYNWKYLGTREIYIPYNNYDLASDKLKYKQILGASNVTSKYTRWELHRVHVVEADLKPSARHIYKKRVFYIDADSWGIALVDQYDNHDELWRVSMAFLTDLYDMPGVWTSLNAYYDLQAHRYYVHGLDNEEPSTYVFENKAPDPRYFSPFSLRRFGR
ncbi:DUF1329 domain-containing protein [Mangrovitalea sediminis]|uniref:DUF1329 domain-containing protein n=1 Tax=Mangrovitalea sediminis TaxID=1982043 RepID=UPI000BE59D40|nr:DUF1329 domain-containing protein [Mangrovitalea sediminis]